MRCAVILTYAFLLLVAISTSRVLAYVTGNCSALCQLLGEAPSVSSCERICGAVVAQANEPCGRDLLSSSPEHLALLSYSSGHVAETVAILLGVANASVEAVAFLSGLHLYDRGSPESCATLEDAHYCLGQGVVLPAAVGLCLPQSCDSTAVSNFFGNITDSSGSSSSNGIDDFNGADVSTEITFFCGDEGALSVDGGTIAMFIAIGTLAALITAGTALEHVRLGRGDKYLHSSVDENYSGRPDCMSRWKQDAEEEGGNISREEENGYDGSGESGKGDEFIVYGTRGEDPGREPLLDHRPSSAQVGVSTMNITWYCECLECFSLPRNVKKLMAPPRPANEFGALEGVRTLSMLWVLLGHALVYALQGPGFTNTIDVLSVLSRLSAQAITGAFFAVDSFFLMSGFLVSSMLLPRLDLQSAKGCGWVLQVYLHRYLRLTPTILFVTLFYWKILPLLGEGATWWPLAERQESVCRKYWWTEVTYLSNVVPFPWVGTDGCLAVTWYLANDMQFFLVAVPLVILYHHSRRIGVAVVLALVMSSCCYILWLGFSTDVRFSIIMGANPDWGRAYASPWARCPVYLIGILGGFVWHTKFRGRRSSLIGNNTEGNAPRAEGAQNFMWQQTALVVPVTAIVSALLLAVPVYGAYWSYQDAQKPTVPLWADHLYLAFSRPTWALGLSLMCALCFCGNGGPINWLMTRPAWATPSRLTFCAYLTHPILLILLYGSRGIPIRFTELELSFTYMGLVVGTFACAAVLHLLVEAPFRNLESWARQRGRN